MFSTEQGRRGSNLCFRAPLSGRAESAGDRPKSKFENGGIMGGIEAVQSAGAALVLSAGDALLQAAAAGQSVRITVGGSAVRALSGLPTPPHEQSQFRAGEDMELLGHGLGWS